MHRRPASIIGLLTLFVAGSWAAAASTATLTKTHLCCGSCVKAAQAAVASVNGATGVADQASDTITITAPDDASAQSAMDALAAAGFYGTATGATIKDDSGAPSGTVTSLTLSGMHNCCPKCAKAINKIIASVPGATGKIEPKATTVTITGSFDAQALVQAFNAGGFWVKAAQ
jgi:periplasmic mercuric ion binding protein